MFCAKPSQCTPSTEVFAYSARGAQPHGACTKPPALPCPPGWKTSSRNFINLLLAAPTPTKNLSFFPRRHFKSCARRSKRWIHHTHHTCPGCPHRALPSLTLLPCCTFARILTAPWQRNFTFSASFAHTSATLAGAACVIQDSRWESRLREADKAGIQGGKGWITPKLFCEQHRAIPSTVPLRQSSASPEWKLMPFKSRV